jgi:hypothetical protein
MWKTIEEESRLTLVGKGVTDIFFQIFSLLVLLAAVLYTYGSAQSCLKITTFSFHVTVKERSFLSPPQ